MMAHASACRAQASNDTVRHALQFIVLGQRNVKRHRETGDFNRERGSIPGQDDHRSVAAEGLCGILEGTNRCRIGEVRLQILEMEDAFDGQCGQVAEERLGICRAMNHPLAVDPLQTAGHRPREHRQL